MRLTKKQKEEKLSLWKTSRAIVSSRYAELSNCKNCDPRATQNAGDALVALDELIKDLEGKL